MFTDPDQTFQERPDPIRKTDLVCLKNIGKREERKLLTHFIIQVCICIGWNPDPALFVQIQIRNTKQTICIHKSLVNTGRICLLF